MKTVNTQNPAFIRTGLIGLALCLAAVGTAAQASPFDVLDKWQNNRLFQPTPRQRVQETKGKVVIYDGLTDSTVNKAMDSNFDRIQNMMFIRVIRTDKGGKPLHKEDGSVQVEDDDC